MRKNKERCDGCGKFVRHCDLLADGDEAICIRCWSARCDEIERREAEGVAMQVTEAEGVAMIEAIAGGGQP